MNAEELAAPCGIYCGWCPHFINGNCGGCGKGGPDKCPIRRCSKRGEAKFCTGCGDFPCGYIYGMYSDMSKFLNSVKKKYYEKETK